MVDGSVHAQTSQAEPNSLIWFINEVGMLTTKLSELLIELNSNIELLAVKTSLNFAETMNG
jgi:hypothetical protein